jgi:L-fuconolactonase
VTSRGRRPMVCDSQVHAPDVPHAVHVDGIDPEPLLREMAAAGVDRCVIVPLAAGGGDDGANNAAAVEMARARPDRFAVMGRFELTRPQDVRLIPTWRSGRMLGMRLSFVRDPNAALLCDGELGWFFAAAEEAGIPLMVLVPNHLLPEVGKLADRYPGLPLTVDHLGLTPYVVYDDPGPAIRPLLELADRPNVAVKASALPASVPDPYPFRSLHEPLHRVIDAFGPRRVFWGSDLTRLRCPYADSVRLFTDELPFLSDEDREWVLGRGVMAWLDWQPAPLAGAGAP